VAAVEAPPSNLYLVVVGGTQLANNSPVVSAVVPKKVEWHAVVVKQANGRTKFVFCALLWI